MFRFQTMNGILYVVVPGHRYGLVRAHVAELGA